MSGKSINVKNADLKDNLRDGCTESLIERYDKTLESDSFDTTFDFLEAARIYSQDTKDIYEKEVEEYLSRKNN